MSAVQEAMGQRERGQGPLRRLVRWPSGWPLLAMPTSLIVYVLVVLACDMALVGWELAATPPRMGDLLLFCALLAAAVVCIDASWYAPFLTSAKNVANSNERTSTAMPTSASCAAITRAIAIRNVSAEVL